MGDEAHEHDNASNALHGGLVERSDHAQSFAEPSGFKLVLLSLSYALVPNVEAQIPLTGVYRLAQNLSQPCSEYSLCARFLPSPCECLVAYNNHPLPVLHGRPVCKAN